MLFLPLITTLLLSRLASCGGTPAPCGCTPIYAEEYRGSYVPKVIDTEFGPQVVAPDTPYVAATGPNELYFLDIRTTPETARHAKENLERARLPKVNEYVAIDEILATAEIRNRVTNKTIFVFDPVYARIFFSRGMNKKNPDLKLPEYEPPGDWVVTYDLDTIHSSVPQSP
ncbi:hypothetical protein PEX1_041710 [Penicillium expansum]|nr:hypothetical protein PEXP_066640 [Penicillium expansum]KGO70104.1 hypothetical protein PEX1_041710 [Penicillium expansum]